MNIEQHSWIILTFTVSKFCLSTLSELQLKFFKHKIPQIHLSLQIMHYFTCNDFEITQLQRLYIAYITANRTI